MALSEFLAGLLGGLIGGCCTLLGVLVSHKLSGRNRRREQDELLQGVLQGLHDEIETLWDIYIERVGRQVETLKDGKGIESYWVVTQDYFTIYTSNCHLIGRISDVDLRKEIISTYTIAKSLLDSFRMNNELVNQLEQAMLLANETGNETHMREATLRRQQVVTYAIGLKIIHAELRDRTSSLLRNLRKYGVLNQKKN